MRYDMQRLERMTLEELRTAADELGVKVKRTHTPKMIAYLILDAQADQRAADVEAKEAEKTAKRAERQRVRVHQAPQKINTSQLKSNSVLATVGNAQEQIAQMQEQLKQNNHKANKTVQAVEARKPLNEAKMEELKVKFELRDCRRAFGQHYLNNGVKSRKYSRKSRRHSRRRENADARRK